MISDSVCHKLNNGWNVTPSTPAGGEARVVPAGGDKKPIVRKKNPWLSLQCYNEGEFPQATATGNGLVHLSCPMVEPPPVNSSNMMTNILFPVPV